MEIPYCFISPDPKNFRILFREINELAESIRCNGLLQNLVVRRTGEDEFVIVCGERRYRALTVLIRSGLLFADSMVECLVVDPSDLESQTMMLAENISRDSMTPWEIGTAYQHLADQGMTQREIADSLGTKQQAVSRFIAIATNIHPDVLGKIKKLGSASPGAADLIVISRITDEFERPDKEAQLRALVKVQFERTSRGRRKPAVNYLLNKLKKMHIDPAAQPVVEAVVHYLTWEDKTFKYETGRD